MYSKVKGKRSKKVCHYVQKESPPNTANEGMYNILVLNVIDVWVMYQSMRKD